MSLLRGPIIQYKQGIQTCYDDYFNTKQHFTIPVFLGFQKMSLSNLFPI